MDLGIKILNFFRQLFALFRPLLDSTASRITSAKPYTVMRIVWDPSSAHERHAPEFDSHLGHPIPFYDTPIRLQNVELQLRAVFGNAAFSPYTDHGLEPIRRVHRSDYLYFVKNIYQHWQGLGGNDAGVMPDTFCMHRFARRSIPVQQGLCDAAKSTVERLQQGVTERLWAFYRTLLNASPAYPPLIQGDAIDEVLAPYGAGNMGFLDGGNPGFYTYDVGAAIVSGIICAFSGDGADGN